VGSVSANPLRDLTTFLRDQRASDISLRELAKLAGVSSPYLSQVERGLRRPSAEILQQIAKGLRVSAEALHVQAGLIDEREGASEIPGVVLADPQLSERQKQVLLDIYESFRRENAVRSAEVGSRNGPRSASEPGSEPASESPTATASESPTATASGSPTAAASESPLAAASDASGDAWEAATQALSPEPAPEPAKAKASPRPRRRSTARRTPAGPAAP